MMTTDDHSRRPTAGPAPIEDLGPVDLVTAQSTIALRLDSKAPFGNIQVVYAKAASATIYPASLTKLMTALLAVEKCADLTTPIMITSADVRTGSGNYFFAGDTLTLHGALHALLIPSSNTMAEAIARTVGGLEGNADPRAAFLDLMHARAERLGMTDTVFTNPSGLHNDEMISTAHDILLLLRGVAKHPDLVDLLGKRHAAIDIAADQDRVRRVRTTVNALNHIEVVAGKTGTRAHDPAQYNLAAIAQGEDGETFAFVTMASPSSDARDRDTASLLQHLIPSATGPDLPRLDADEVAKVTDGSWLRTPPPDWRLHRGARFRGALREGRSLTNALIPIWNTSRALPKIDKSAIDASSNALLVQQDTPTASTRFPLLRVPDVEGAMAALARHRRDVFPGKVVAVTGSVGKTTTRWMLGSILSGRFDTYFSRRSLNLLSGVREHCIALSEQSHAVIEVAVSALPEAAHLLRSDVAVVTAISEARMESLHSVEETARAKAQIFLGLNEGGTAVLNRDALHADILLEAAAIHAAHIITYGRHKDADIRLLDYDHGTGLTKISIFGTPLEYRLGPSGEHNALNSLAVICTICALKEDVSRFTDFFRHVELVSGRGTTQEVLLDRKRIMLVDQSYNANPLSMRAALADFGARFKDSRRVLVLGDMLELGPTEASLHADLLEPVLKADPQAVYLFGPMMTHLWARLPEDVRGAHVSSISQLRAVLATDVQEGDAVLIKSSRATGFEKFVASLVKDASSATSESWRVTISGTAVHGVGFRQRLKKRALADSIDGWVRNRTDGKVEALLSGYKADLEHLYPYLHSGPRKAEVSQVLMRRVSIKARPGFRIRQDRVISSTLNRPSQRRPQWFRGHGRTARRR